MTRNIRGSEGGSLHLSPDQVLGAIHALLDHLDSTPSDPTLTDLLARIEAHATRAAAPLGGWSVADLADAIHTELRSTTLPEPHATRLRQHLGGDTKTFTLRDEARTRHVPWDPATAAQQLLDRVRRVRDRRPPTDDRRRQS